jgi:predicted ATPase
MSAGPAPFAGRGREIGVLRELLKAAKAGNGSCVLITGEPGIGKTRLAQHFAAQLDSPAPSVLWGRCHPDPDVPPYWPWKQVIARYAERRDDTTLHKELGAAARDIVPLVPQLVQRFPELAGRQTQEPPEARQRVFEGVVEFLKNAARRQPLLIVFDDLQWIDDASLTLLELSANECRESPFVLIAISRTTHFADPRTEMRVGELLRNGHHLALTGLGESKVAALIGAISGRAVPRSVSQTLHETTQGNPLFLDQLARFITAHDAWDHVDLRRLGLPHELKLAIRSRLAGLSERAQSTLARAAVIGKTISINVLAKVEGLPIEDLLEVLREPLAARVLQEVAGSPGEYTFSHILIRETLYDELPALERANAHRRVAEAIVELHGPDLRDHLSAVAHHFFQTAGKGSAEAAIDYCARSGDHAFACRAYEEAIGHYRRALLALELGNMDQCERGSLLLRLGRSQRYAGEVEEAKKTFLEAIAVARATLSNQLLAEAALGFAGAWNAPLYLPDEQVLEVLRDASERLRGTHPALRARVIARRVHEHWWSLPRDQARTELGEALELAEASRNPDAIAHVLHIHHLALWNHEDLSDRLATAAKIVSLRDSIEKELTLEGYQWLMTDELEGGNFSGFEAARRAH